MYKIILFDLDGTIIDSSLGVTNSVKYALSKFNIEVKNNQELLSYMGPPLLYSFQTFHGLSKEDAEIAIGYYRETYKEKGIFENTVYPGILELLVKLKEQGFKIGLATSKPEKFAEIILDRLGISKYFDEICGASLDQSRSEKIDVMKYVLNKLEVTNHNEVLMVGDRMYDINASNELGIDSVGVLFGFGSYEEFKKARATYIVNNALEILNIVKK